MSDFVDELHAYRHMAAQIKVPLCSVAGLPADERADKEIAATVTSMERRARAAARHIRSAVKLVRDEGRIRARRAAIAEAGLVPTEEDKTGDVFRGCPWCGEPIRWFDVDSSEVPECLEHGVLDFWLVLAGFRRPIGFACAYGGTLWASI